MDRALSRLPDSMSPTSFGLIPATNMVTASRRRFSLPKSLIMAQGLPHGLEPRERGGRVVLNNLSEEIRESYSTRRIVCLKLPLKQIQNLSVVAAISDRLANGTCHG